MNTQTMAEVFCQGIKLCENDQEKVVYIDNNRCLAKFIQIEDPIRSCDSNEYWLMEDDSVVRVSNPNNVVYSPFLVDYGLDTITGRLKQEELIAATKPYFLTEDNLSIVSDLVQTSKE